MSVPFEQYNNLVPVRVAAKHSGYTTDYITRLAREGKIAAEKQGRQWFIDLHALQQFARAVQQQNAIRKELLRQERKREQLRGQGESILVSYAEAIDAGRLSAFVQTILISSIAGMVALAQISIVSPAQVSNQLANTSDVGTSLVASLERSALALYYLVHPQTPAKTDVGSNVWSGNTPAQPVRAYSFTVLSEEEAAQVVADGFSDDVDVTFDVETPGAGVVIPQFRSREDSAYRFQIFLEKTSGAANVDIE